MRAVGYSRGQVLVEAAKILVQSMLLAFMVNAVVALLPIGLAAIYWGYQGALIVFLGSWVVTLSYLCAVTDLGYRNRLTGPR